jgi:hypothetical protein
VVVPDVGVALAGAGMVAPAAGIDGAAQLNLLGRQQFFVRQ